MTSENQTWCEEWGCWEQITDYLGFVKRPKFCHECGKEIPKEND